jgi:hypothetical protein
MIRVRNRAHGNCLDAPEARRRVQPFPRRNLQCGAHNAPSASVGRLVAG